LKTKEKNGELQVPMSIMSATEKNKNKKEEHKALLSATSSSTKGGAWNSFSNLVYNK
jgi:hypothetical protein